MNIGDRKSAVAALEKIQDSIPWQTELGGDCWLELAMALETVDRTDEARKIYGKLLAVSWSTKVRRNALGLVQGLDIAAKIRKTDTGTRKPAMDMANMEIVAQVGTFVCTCTCTPSRQAQAQARPSPAFRV